MPCYSKCGASGVRFGRLSSVFLLAGCCCFPSEFVVGKAFAGKSAAEALVEDLLEDIQEARLLTYIPYDGSHDAYHRDFRDEDGLRIFDEPYPKVYVDGVVGQARDYYEASPGMGSTYYGIHQGAASVYPMDESVNRKRGTLSLWFRWSKNWRERLKWGDWDGGANERQELPEISLVGFLELMPHIAGKARDDGEWHHLAVAWNEGKGQARIWLDGAQVRKCPVSDVVNEQGGFVIGRCFPGAIDEVCVWDQALPEEAIREAYRRAGGGNAAWPDNVLPARDTPYRLDYRVKNSPAARPPIPADVDWRLRPDGASAAPGLTRYSLAGKWRMQPTGRTSATESTPNADLSRKRLELAKKYILAEDWLYARMPGPWADEEGTFLGVPTTRYPTAWVERDFDAPESWRGRRVTLDIDAIGNGHSCDSRIYVNGDFVSAACAFVRHRIDVTDFLKFGAKNRLLVHLGSGFLGKDIWLSAHESAAIGLGNVYVSPLVLEEKLRLRFDVFNRAGKPVDGTISCALQRWHHNDQEQKREPVPVSLSAERRQELSIEIPAGNLTPWTPDDPTLYTISLTLADKAGNVLDSTPAARFGYRTVAIDAQNAQILLNGRPLHFRGGSHNLLKSDRLGKPFGAGNRIIGKNADRTYHPEGNFPNVDAGFDCLDEAGHLVHFNCSNPKPGRVCHEHPFWRNYFARRRDYLQNHPSFVIWQPWMTGYFPAPWGHPLLMGAVPGKDFDPKDPGYAEVKRAIAVVEEIDPEHPMYFYRAGIGGNVRAHMNYLGPAVTIQGKEEWPRYWHENRERIGEPMMGSEVDILIFLWDSLWQLGLQTFRPHTHSAYDPFGYGAWFLGEPAYAGVTARHVATLEVVCHLPGFGAAARDFERKAMANPDGFVDLDASGENPGKSAMEKELASLGEEPVRAPKQETPAEPAGYRLEDGALRQALIENNRRLMCSRGIGPRYRAEWLRRVIRAWRTYGIGYMIHCDFSGESLMAGSAWNEAGLAVVKNNAPVLVYIGGAPDDFVRKDHAFFAGERVAKQIVIVNDRFKPVEVLSCWRVVNTDKPADEPIARGQDKTTVPPGETVFREIEFDAPNTDAKQRLTIVVESTVDGERRILPVMPVHEYQPNPPVEQMPEMYYGDEFAIQVFPRRAPPQIGARTALLDTVGCSSSLLTGAGVKFTCVNPTQSLEGVELLVIGRESYTAETAEWLAGREIADGVARGMNVIVFEQRSRWLTGLRMKHLNDRDVFVCDPNDPLLQGLSDEDFRNWRGESDIIPAYPLTPKIAEFRGEHAGRQSRVPEDEPEERDPRGGRKPGHGDDLGDAGGIAHWSNNNMVSTYTFVKPQKAGYRCILQCGFDLLYSPLVERRLGKGRILYCQLDVSNRYGLDPVATMLVDRMLSEYSRPAETPSGRLVTLNKGKAYELALKLGFAPDSVAGPMELGTNDVVLVHGADGDSMEKLKAWGADMAAAVRQGACLFLVKAGSDTPLSFLPCRLEWERKEVFEHTAPKDWPLLKGLGPSDFFWRRTIAASVPRVEAANARELPSGLLVEAPAGKGRVVFFQADDDIFDKPYDRAEKDRLSSQIINRWTRVKIYRVLSALLANCGAPSPVPESLGGNSYAARTTVYVERGEPFHAGATRGW